MTFVLLLSLHGLLVPLRPFTTLEDCRDYAQAAANDYTAQAEARGFDPDPPQMDCAKVEP